MNLNRSRVFIVIEEKMNVMKKFFSLKISILVSASMLIALLGVLQSCTKSSMTGTTGTTGTNGGTNGMGGTAANEVLIQGMAFNPSILNVTEGTTVVWTNKDNVTHNVTSNPALFSSGSLATWAMYSYTFNTAGTYSYSCTIHPSMVGSIVVSPVASTPGY